MEQLSSPLESEPAVSLLSRRPKNGPPPRPSSGRGGTWGSISRVFARSRHRNKSNPVHSQSADGQDADSYRSWSPLTEEGYAEKLRLLREAASIPMERWRAPTVLAWLEIALGMPQYGPRCAENVKSGKVCQKWFVMNEDYTVSLFYTLWLVFLFIFIFMHTYFYYFLGKCKEKLPFKNMSFIQLTCVACIKDYNFISVHRDFNLILWPNNLKKEENIVIF